MKRIAYLIPFAAILMFSACKEDKKTTEPEVVTVDNTQKELVYAPFETDASFKDPELAELYDLYIRLKTAFVNTNPKVASGAANRMVVAMEGMEADNKLMVALVGIAEAPNVEAQRALFVNVTEAMEGMLEGALESGTIYKQYCPMAFNNTGGYWLSNSKEIRNPYFGEKMMKCGRIDSEIK